MDTICALATAPGGAIGIIRISGDQSLEILSHIFNGTGDVESYAANTIHFGHIIAQPSTPHPSSAKHLSTCWSTRKGRGDQRPGQGEDPIIDEVLISILRSPHSYTGEDCVEISCHGSRYILNKVLDLLIQNGCRLAKPGEYTMRAFLNGKMDLSQAEAVADLIACSNKATHQIAMSQLRGQFSSELSQLREQLLTLTSLLELELDFSDHEDLEFADRSEILEIAKKIDNRILSLAHSFEIGQALKEGIPVAIVGKTNVGKSTLLNKLVGDDRAIVSSVHGTTRDTIEDTTDINGITFRFVDTAGMRETTDEVEQIGISRTYAAIDKAHIILWLIDTNPTEEDIKEILERTKDKSLIIVRNKIDLLSSQGNRQSGISKLNGIHTVEISAKKGTNIDKLEQAILESSHIPELSEHDVVVTSARQYQSLAKAHENLSRVVSGLTRGLSGDLISEDLRLVLDDLSDITGEGRIVHDEVLGNIFANFCVGK